MNKLELLRTFVRVSEMSSFTLAGESLGLPRSTVSDHVQALETLLGTRLLQRTTRKVQATQDGIVLYERSKDLLSHMDEIEGLFRQDAAALTGRIRIDMPNILARRVVMPRLPEFMAQHPHLELEISSTDRRVDLLGEGFDCVCGSARSRINRWSPATCATLSWSTAPARLICNAMVCLNDSKTWRTIGWCITSVSWVRARKVLCTRWTGIRIKCRWRAASRSTAPIVTSRRAWVVLV